MTGHLAGKFKDAASPLARCVGLMGAILIFVSAHASAMVCDAEIDDATQADSKFSSGHKRAHFELLVKDALKNECRHSLGNVESIQSDLAKDISRLEEMRQQGRTGWELDAKEFGVTQTRLYVCAYRARLASCQALGAATSPPPPLRIEPLPERLSGARQPGTVHTITKEELRTACGPDIRRAREGAVKITKEFIEFLRTHPETPGAAKEMRAARKELASETDNKNISDIDWYIASQEWLKERHDAPRLRIDFARLSTSSAAKDGEPQMLGILCGMRAQVAALEGATPAQGSSVGKQPAGSSNGARDDPEVVGGTFRP